MVCSKCGKEVADTSIFCSYCGNEFELVNALDSVVDSYHTIRPEEFNDNVKQEKPIKKKLPIKIILASIGILLVSLIVLYNNNPYTQFVSAIKNNKIEKAKAAFARITKDEDKEKIKEYLTQEIEKIKLDYIDNKINAEDALKLINSMASFKPLCGNRIAIDYINKIENSKIAFAKLDSLMKQEKYKKVIDEALKVVKEDSNYDSAKAYKEKARTIYGDQIFKKSESLALNGDYIGAYEEIQNNINYINQNSIVADTIFKYKKIASEDIIKQARNEFQSGNYIAAIELLNESIEYSINDNITEEINKIENEHYIAIVKDIKNRVTVNYDKVDKKHLIAPKGYSTRYININRSINIEPRMSFTSVPSFSIVVGFHQNDWIFFKKVIFLIDDIKSEWGIEYFDRQTQVIHGGISEWMHVIHSKLLSDSMSRIKNLKPLIDNIIESKSTIIRFRGDGYRDHVVTTKEKQTIEDLWKLYDILNKKPDLFELLK